MFIQQTEKSFSFYTIFILYRGDNFIRVWLNERNKRIYEYETKKETLGD